MNNVYSEVQSLRNSYTGILSIFSTRVWRGQHLTIFEDGQEAGDFVHVEYVTKSFLAAIQSLVALSVREQVCDD
jgi:dTDP-L-rhamnose 4-epimerase